MNDVPVPKNMDLSYLLACSLLAGSMRYEMYDVPVCKTKNTTTKRITRTQLNTEISIKVGKEPQKYDAHRNDTVSTKNSAPVVDDARDR